MYTHVLRNMKRALRKVLSSSESNSLHDVSPKFPRFAVQVTFEQPFLALKFHKNKLRNPFLRILSSISTYLLYMIHDRFKYNNNISCYAHTLINTCCMSSCVTTCDTLIELCTNPEDSQRYGQSYGCSWDNRPFQALTKRTSDAPRWFPPEIIQSKQLDHRRQEHFGWVWSWLQTSPLCLWVLLAGEILPQQMSTSLRWRIQSEGEMMMTFLWFSSRINYLLLYCILHLCFHIFLSLMCSLSDLKIQIQSKARLCVCVCVMFLRLVVFNGFVSAPVASWNTSYEQLKVGELHKPWKPGDLWRNHRFWMCPTCGVLFGSISLKRKSDRHEMCMMSWTQFFDKNPEISQGETIWTVTVIAVVLGVCSHSNSRHPWISCQFSARWRMLPSPWRLDVGLQESPGWFFF